MSRWRAALDAFEARVEAQRAALDRGEAGELAPFDPPVSLGPLPPTLAPRAHALLRAAQDLAEELRGNVVALRDDLAVVRALEASTGRDAGARVVDTTA